MGKTCPLTAYICNQNRCSFWEEGSSACVFAALLKTMRSIEGHLQQEKSPAPRKRSTSPKIEKNL